MEGLKGGKIGTTVIAKSIKNNLKNYPIILNNVDKMDKLLERHNLPKELPQKEMENLNESISIREFESIMKKFSTKKSL